ncbi:restriction endonuclease subunit S [Amycolatopsis sp. RTGN1]|uniref:restriction endonuclease subunit S n=1 Tax=Amycolatopsis ponsaeliensis TaxID=2992142 RepID=UPI00254B0F58|nr:restriction endonuclease subunit S [Amycolatopsis sp. RTGN1]
MTSEFAGLPADWAVRTLGSLGRVVRGGSPRPAGDPRYFKGSFVPWLTVASLTTIPPSQVWVTETGGFLTEEGARRSRTLEPNTLVISNSGATLGVAKILKIRCCANDGIGALIDQHSGNKEFICQYLNTQTGYLRDVVAPGNGQPNLNTSLIEDIAVPFPSEPEQAAIAAVLRDADDLISSLTAAIVKRRAIKLGMMQELLTGRTRIGSVAGAWPTVRLLDLVTIASGQVDPRRPEFRDLPLIAPDHIESGTGRLLAVKTAAEQGAISGKYLAEPGDVIYSKIRPYLRKAHVARFRTLCSADMYPLRPKSGVDPEFVLNALLGARFTDFAASASMRSGIPKINRVELAAFELTVPPCEEQQKIAEVLLDADAEIAALERRLESARAIKTGMMQELLTGRTRLPVEAVS